VWAAVDRATGDRVAIKVLRASSRGAEQAARFAREGAVLRTLDSPRICRARAVGTMPDGAPFIAMDLAPGRPLAAILAEERSLALADVLVLGDHVLEALVCAHRAG